MMLSNKMMLADMLSSLNYYYVIICVTLVTLGLLCILVMENNQIHKKDKKVFYLTYLVVAFAAVAECLGIMFNGNTNVSNIFLRIVKCLDYILTPIAGAALSSQFRSKSIFRRIIQIAIAFNTLFQIVSAFTGWMTKVDEFGYYSHGPLYMVYVGIYLFLIVMIVGEFIIYGQKFRKQNRASLYTTIIFAMAGILTQELSSGQFRIAYLTLTIGMAMLYIHNNEFAQQKAYDSIQEQKIKNMLSQIQPHFIYNSLNAIQAIDGVPEKAKNAIIDFSKYLRENLDSLTGSDLVSFDKEVEHLQKYISLEKLRFGDKVNVKFDIKCKDFMLPVLTLQMLVENAIKHGITKKYEGGTVEVITEQNGDNFVITVKDDGVGFDKQKVQEGSHYGLSNIKKRLEHFVNGTIEIESELNKGTTAIITIPKTNKTVIQNNKKISAGGGIIDENNIG